MSDLAQFPITRRWPAKEPSKLQLYSFPTPNGIKVSTMLEETGLDYEAHRVTLADADVKSDEFLSLNPNNKIPAIVDPDGPGGEPIGLFESGAILLYLADKTGRFGGSGADAWKVRQWLMWQMGGLGPFMGQMGFWVKLGGKDWDEPKARERYVNEATRLLNVVNGALEGEEWIAGDYSIADMAIAPWLNAIHFYGAEEHVGWSGLTNLDPYVERWKARPAAQRAMNIPPREG